MGDLIKVGKGSLEGWIRVSAVRIALRQKQRRSSGAPVTSTRLRFVTSAFVKSLPVSTW